MKTYKFKLYKSKRNKYLHSQIDLACEIYNHCIALYKRYYRIYKKHIPAYKMQAHITKLKHLPAYKHWYTLNSQSIQDVVDRIDRAYTIFFQNIKRGFKANPPNFKRPFRYKSFTLKQTGYKLVSNNKIQIGKKTYKFFKSRKIEGNIKTITIKRDELGDLYLFILTDMEETREAPRTGEIVGFDFGLKTFLTASNEEDVEPPLFFKQNRSKLRKAHKQVSSKKKVSKNRRKALANLNRVYRKVSNQREDFQWKLANDLTDKYDILCFETLNIKGMQRLWGRKISDLSFSSFILKLKYLACIKSKTLVFINRFEPSSKTCSVCGYLYKDLELRDRSWLCSECKTQHDRDRNASYNILRVGASTLGLGDVRPALQAISA
ncbi:transposase [Candidatus Poribacteria bacterium]|nr:transposase [Candidatus Poribacteria bacterium]